MSDIFNYLVISVCLISGYTLLVSIFNVFYFKKPKLLKPKSNKKISIIVPCRNEEKNILECVNSLLEQDYENIEIILVDDNGEVLPWVVAPTPEPVIAPPDVVFDEVTNGYVP